MKKMQRAGHKAHRKRIENLIAKSTSEESFPQLASEYIDLRIRYDTDMSVEGILARELNHTTIASFRRYGDRNHMTAGMILKWFRKGALPLDVQAMYISASTGIEVTADDCAAFIMEHPNGSSGFHMVQKLRTLEQVSKEQFAINLTWKVAQWFAA